MRTLKSYFALMAVFALMLSSCSKDEPVANDPAVSNDVAVLSLGPVLNSMMNKTAVKQAVADLPACSEAAPAYAQISLTYGDADTPVDVTVDILSDDNGLFTAYDNALEIPVPSGATTVSVTLTDFLVWSDNGGSPGEVIWAAPKTGSDYADFVDQALPMTWDLRAGSKTYTDVPVLCFDNRQVNLYGYQFFDVIPTELSTLCFFANYCTDAGRHYTANYSLDLYLGTSDAGTPLYMDQMPATGQDGEDFYADPICLAVPAPADGVGADEPYLYYVVTLMDWPDSYGTAGDYVETGTLTWNDVQALLNDDGTTAEYEHIFINCGGEEPPACDLNDPEADCDNDGVLNGDDMCPGTPAGVQVNAEGCTDTDGDGIADSEDPCPNDPTNTCDQVTCDIDALDSASCARGITPDSGTPDYANVGDFFEATEDGPLPLLQDEGDAFGAAIGTAGISISGGALTVTLDPTSSLYFTDYRIEVMDSQGGDISCLAGVDLAVVDNGDTVDYELNIEGSFSYPIYVRIMSNECPLP